MFRSPEKKTLLNYYGKLIFHHQPSTIKELTNSYKDPIRTALTTQRKLDNIYVFKVFTWFCPPPVQTLYAHAYVGVTDCRHMQLSNRARA